MIFFLFRNKNMLFLNKNILWYSLEAPQRGASNEYHNIFLFRNEKNISTFWLKKAPYLELYSTFVNKTIH